MLYRLEHALDYYPYGQILREHTNCNPAPYLTTHHERDEETGYDYRGARYYDAEVGRFLGVDPIADEFAWVTPYNYAENEPVAHIDLWGLQKVRVVYWDVEAAGGIGGVGGAGAKFQRGIAYDNIGVTLYQASTAVRYTGKGESFNNDTPDNLITGGDIGLSIGFIQDSESLTFEEFVSKHASTSFSVGPGDLETGDQQVGFDIGFGVGLAIDKMNLTVTSSLSITKNEWESIGGLLSNLNITVGDINPIWDDNGKVTGYSGEVVKYGYLGGKTNTGIIVSSGVIAENGKYRSNDIWKSNEYREELNQNE